jgi:F420-dependent oxidoreductase-like protein
MDIAIMVEGQMGLNWPRWQAMARAVESLGFAGLYRSDHFTNPEPPDLDSLELWTSLTWLATNTSRLFFGPLVSPVSFRHPVLTARMAAAVDDLSGGRLQLGIGAGWQDREHANYSFDLLPMPERVQRYREGVAVIAGLLRQDEPLTYSGQYYTLRDALLLPRPARPGGPRIVIGGRRGTFSLVVQYADEWNVPFATPAEFRVLNSRLNTLLQEAGRPVGAVRRSIMTGLVFGRDEAEVRARLAARGQQAEDQRARGVIVGTPGAVLEQLGELAAAGADGVMLQWLDLDDLDGLEALARAVLPTA